MRRIPSLLILLAALLAARAAWGGAADADPNAPINESAYTGKIKIACVGDSITLGVGTKPAPKNATAPVTANAYPMQLARMLGDHYEVKNFPNSGHTLLAKGDKPYTKEKPYQDSLDYKPDIVIIMLGTNDTKTTPNNWQYKNDFVADYTALVQKYLAANPKPRIFLCNPPWVRNDGLGTINEPDVVEEIPMIATVAKNLNLGIIDIHSATKAHDELYAPNENVHPNNEGAQAMAKTVYHALTGKDYAGPSTITTTPPATQPNTAPR